jgi:NitT/TauT family transport system substrate-binding protein
VKVRLVLGVAAVSLLAAGLLAFTGCGPNNAGGPGGKPLHIAYSDWPGWLVWEIANQKGWCKDAGVDVKFDWADYGATIDEYSAGKVDAVLIVCGDALTAGKPSTAIVLTDYSDGNDMLIGKEGIASVKDMKGKKVGVERNLVEHILLDWALEHNDPKMTEDDVSIVDIKTNDAPQTLRTGGADVIGAWYPIAAETLANVGGSKALYTSKNAPGLIYDALQVDRESLASRRDDWKKVVGVWFRCLAYLKDPKTHEDAVKIMAGRVTGLKPEDLEKHLQGTHLLDRDANLKALEKRDTLDSVYGSLKNADAFYLRHKLPDYDKPKDINTYVDPSLVKETPVPQ